MTLIVSQRPSVSPRRPGIDDDERYNTTSFAFKKKKKACLTQVYSVDSPIV